jgi:HEAT repeat protein
MGRYSGHNWDSSADTAVALMDALKNDESYEVRATAAAELSKYKVDNVLESLLTALGDKSAAVRAAAAESLGKLDKPQAVDRLLELLYFEKDEAVLICALRALKFCDDPRLEQPLVTALGSGSSKVRWQAIDVIEVFKPRSAVEPLRKMFEDEYESEGIRNKAREALDLMGAE